MSQSNPVNQVFNIGKALVKVLSEKVEEGMTNVLSEWGKFEAEQKEKLRQFSEEVMTKAKQEANSSNGTSATTSGKIDETEDLQETLDELRSEIARLRAELKNHRS
jgi:hypothetical protein